VDSDRAQLGGKRTRKPLGESIVAAAAEREHRRPLGERPLQSRDPAAFLIDADPERPVLRQGCDLPGQLGHLTRVRDVSGEVDDTGKIERCGEPTKVAWNAFSAEADDREPADMASKLPKRHPAAIIMRACASIVQRRLASTSPAAPTTSGRSISFTIAHRRS